jgi:glyoxylate carboligase
MLERVIHIYFGTEIDAIKELEGLAASLSIAPTAIGLLDQPRNRRCPISLRT